MRMRSQGCGFDTMGTGYGLNSKAYYKSYFTQDFGCSREDFNCQCPQIVDLSTNAALVPVPAPVCKNGVAVPIPAPATAPAPSPVRLMRTMAHCCILEQAGCCYRPRSGHAAP